MAEPFKQTPASRVFGFGLRPQQPLPTYFGSPISVPDRSYLDPFVRRTAFQEQAMAAQEDALAAQQQEMQARQQELMRNQQVLEAEDAAMQDLAAGEQLGNIFKKNPALAFSRNARGFAQAAQMMQPSYAMKAAIPSLAMKLPIEERTIFNQLLNDPEFSTNPFAAYDEAQRRSARARQHGELVKAGVPLSKIDTTRDYAPIEYEDLVRQHTQPKTGNDYLDKLVQQTWTDFDDQYDPPETLTDPMDIALDKAEKKARLREGILAKYGAVKPVAPADAATAQNITAPGAMGGAPAAVTPPSTAPAVDIDTELANVPFAAQKDYLEKKKAVEAERQAIAPVWTKAKEDLGAKIKKIVPDEPFPGTKTNQLESFAKAVLNPRDNIINHPEYGTIPTAWDILSKAGVPMNEIMTNKTVFRQPGEGRRLLGFIGTQQVGYQELLREWAKDFLASKNLKPTGEPTPLLERQPEKIVKKADQFLNEWEK